MNDQEFSSNVRESDIVNYRKDMMQPSRFFKRSFQTLEGVVVFEQKNHFLQGFGVFL